VPVLDHAHQSSQVIAHSLSLSLSATAPPHLPGAVDPKSRMLGIVYNWSLEAELNKIARTDSGSYYSTNSNNAPFRPSLPVIVTIT